MLDDDFDLGEDGFGLVFEQDDLDPDDMEDLMEDFDIRPGRLAPARPLALAGPFAATLAARMTRPQP